MHAHLSANAAGHACPKLAGRSCSRPQLLRPRTKLPKRQTAVKAAAEEVEEEVDPITGNPIPKYAATNPATGLKVKVGNVQWAYRQSEVPEDKKDPNKPAVLLLHGIGSSSFSWRRCLGLLGSDGYDAYAPDFPGHGDSDKPGKDAFGYTEQEFVNGLDAFIDAVGMKKPLALVVQGYILSQYGLLWAAQNESKVSRLMILNTPLSVGARLRPDLAAFKNPIPFLRPKTLDGAFFNANGSPYVMEGKVADVYARPYTEPGANEALIATMDNLDFGKLLKKVDEAYLPWSRPSVILYGSSDPFLKINSVFEFLDSKKTNMKVVNQKAKMGAMPQEDYPDAVYDSMLPWLTGETDKWVSGATQRISRKGIITADGTIVDNKA